MDAIRWSLWPKGVPRGGRFVRSPTAGGRAGGFQPAQRRFFRCQPARSNPPGIGLAWGEFGGGRHLRRRSDQCQSAPGGPKFYAIRGARLAGTDLAEALLKGAELSETDLNGVNLLDTDLSGADLSGARGLNQKQINMPRMGPETVLPPGLRKPEEWS